MKPHLIFNLILLTAVITITGCGQITQTVSAISVTAPTAQDTWQAGKTYTIKWTGGNNADKVGLFLYSTALLAPGSPVSASIQDRITPIDNTGLYQYTVPSGVQGKFKWCVDDLSNINNTEACSGYFEIQ